MTMATEIPAQPKPRPKAASPGGASVESRPAVAPWVGSYLWCTTVVGALAAWVVAYALGVSALQEHHAQHLLYAKFRQQLATQTAPPRALPSGRIAAVHAGDPIAVLTAPRIGLRDAVVVQGTRSGDLRNGPGHLPGTVLPGENGSSWIVGRGTTFGAPFADLTAFRTGDHITVTSQEGVFTFVVNDVRGPGDRIPQTASAARLTLATSIGSGWRTHWAPTTAVYVDATLVGTPRPVTATPQAVSSADAVMHGDPGALVPMFLWLLGLVGAVLVLVWARVRWGVWQAWLAGAPVVLAALWGSTDAVLQLLPNVI